MYARRKKMKAAKASKLQTLTNGTRRLSVILQRINLPDNDKVSLDDVHKWRHEIHDHLKKVNQFDVLGDCDRIFNMTEAHFTLDPSCRTSAACVTTMVVIGASGIMAPPTVFYPNNELPPRNIFDREVNVRNESSQHHTTDNLLTYMQDTFHPFLMSRKNNFPVVIFIDIAHVSLEVLRFCKTNEIILLSTTQAVTLNPIKSVVLPLLKIEWTAELLEWKNKNGNRALAIDLVAGILGRVFDMTVTVDLVKAGFERCGMFPFDPVNVYRDGIASFTTSTPHAGSETNQTIQPTSQNASQESDGMNQSMAKFRRGFDSIPQGIRPSSQPAFATTSTVRQPKVQFEVLLGPVIYEFINTRNFWKGAVENTSLFHVWQLLLKSHEDLIHPKPQTSHSTAQEINEQFRLRFEGLIGPLMHEFKQSGDVWTGATENKSLFEVWKHLLHTLEVSNER